MGLYENRIVVKIGTSTLMNHLGRTDLENMEKLVRVLSDISNLGYEVILVSSGAIAAGANRLLLPARPKSLREKQAAAAVGQCRLVTLYDRFFSIYGKTIAQILLSAEDIEQEQKKENLINTFDTLLHGGVIPIVNANDSVSIGEIESGDHVFGDNDMLSSVVAVLCRARTLVILSDIDGLYTDDPRTNPEAKPITVVEEITPEIESVAGGAGTSLGTGGMSTKINAAKIATAAGIDMVIMNGRDPELLYDLFEDKEIGTIFKAAK